MHVLLTGGSGFLAAHVVDSLLERGHSVVTTVRSQEKADRIASAHSKQNKDQLSFAIVEDIAKPDAFDQAVVSDPPFDAVIHTASPFHFNVTDVKKDLLDPAVIGTTGVLESIKKFAPSVQRVVITSSFAAMLDYPKMPRPGYTYSEADWNPVTPEQAGKTPGDGYRASKTFAERAAWDFVEQQQPLNFTIATINPPLIFGPIVHYLNSLDSLNTSNQRFRDFMLGKAKDEIPSTGMYVWTDVRDVALAHVLAMEVPDAANKRFYLPAGFYTNKEIGQIMRKNFPELKDRLPSETTPGGDFPQGGVHGIDHSRAMDILGIKFRSFESCVVDTVKSLQQVGA